MRAVSQSLLPVSCPALLLLILGLVAQPASGQEKDAAQTNQKRAVLSGQITDESGQPVTDAEITISGPGHEQATTNKEGRYQFDTIRRKGEYRVQVKSKGWIGITDWKKAPVVDLNPESHVTRDFKLARAGQVQIRVIDEEGFGIRGVRINVASLASDKHRNTDSVTTDATGWVIVGGLKPSKVKYIFGLRHKDYSFEKLTELVEEPGLSEVRTVTLRTGVTIKGKAVCSDGQPPAGWRILAMPTWWHFGVSPRGTVIEADGSFELPHIVPGEYEVTISVPHGDNGSSPRTVMVGDLSRANRPLALKMNHPSPASMTTITGKVTFKGKEPDGVWLFARSKDGKFSSSTYVRPEKPAFTIGPIPKGVYSIRSNGTRVEPINLPSVTAPTKDLEIVMKSMSLPTLAGRVLHPDGKTPVRQFKLSVLKMRTLSGPNYVQDARWKATQSDDGSFSVDVNSPGIYRVAAFADGFAPTTSEPFNTTSDEESIRIVLTKGLTLSGVVVDEQGEPVQKALVQPYSLAGRGPNGPSQEFLSEEGAVHTDSEGQFTLRNMAAGPDELKVSAAGFSFAKTKIDPTANAGPVRIILPRGGSIRGLVFDGEGKRAPGRILYFQDGYHGSDYERNRLATASADNKGFYQVDSLPVLPVNITCGDEWNGTGVVRRTVLPQNGRKLTVMFGGSGRMSGTMKLNGEPLANVDLQLADDDANFGIMKARTRTDANGNFTFFGPPPGVWTLYYDSDDGRRQEWTQVRQIEVGAKPEDVGDIDLSSGTVTINCVPADGSTLKGIRLQLIEYDPVWTHGRHSGQLRPRDQESGPFVFDGVTAGHYEIVCRRADHTIRRRLTLEPDNLTRAVDFRLDGGTASVSGTVAAAVVERPSTLRLWSADGQREHYVQVDAEGKFAIDMLPAGKWLIRDRGTRTWPAIYSFSLTDGEKKQLKLTTENVVRQPQRPGFGTIRVYTHDGVLTPCHVSLIGSDGEVVRPNSTQRGDVTYLAAPGRYEVRVSLRGYPTITRPYTLKQTDENFRPVGEFVTNIVLDKP